MPTLEEPRQESINPRQMTALWRIKRAELQRNEQFKGDKPVLSFASEQTEVSMSVKIYPRVKIKFALMPRGADDTVKMFNFYRL